VTQSTESRTETRQKYFLPHCSDIIVAAC